MTNKNPNTEPLLRSIEDKKKKAKQKVETPLEK